MKVRSSYPVEFTAIVLISIFLLSAVFTHYMFDFSSDDAAERESIYFGMGWAGLAVILVTFIVWDELLFHVKLKKAPEDVILFRNSPNKLIIQIILYLGIPAICIFIYFNYKINTIYFVLWAAACLVIPLIKKISSGINNYNDFLLFSPAKIEYKNNKKTGTFPISDITFLKIIKNEAIWSEKLEIGTKETSVIIDLNEMELEEFFEYIELYIHDHYAHLLKS
ncbi:MAG: putative heavy metal rane efflux protein [Chitinophagaceae bacterium]|nr:putative heavy metal rane efflux protein [Chitinophagaceae bacterium]